MSDSKRPRPQPTPETQHYWDGTRDGEFRLQRCDDCAKAYFPPRPFCPACGGRDTARVFSPITLAGTRTSINPQNFVRPHGPVTRPKPAPPGKGAKD